MNYRQHLIPAVVVPIAVSVGLGFGLAIGAGTVALSPASAAAINGVIASVACSTKSACVSGMNSANGPGVAGTSVSGTGTSGTSTSGYGLLASSSSGIGIQASSGSSTAVNATNNASSHATISAKQSGSGIGVIGTATSGSGVSGLSSSGTGVSGMSTSGPGVVSTSSSGDGMDVSSVSSNGVVARSTNFTAVVGVSPNGDGGNFRGDGIGAVASDGEDGYAAVSASDNRPSSGGIGVYGESSNGYAGYFQSFSGAGGGDPTLVAKGPTTNMGLTILQVQSSDGNQFLDVDDSGNVDITGSYFNEDSCNTGCIDKAVRTYNAHESEPSVEDVGNGHLIAGYAFVSLDAAYRNVIDPRAEYTVLITPEGDSNGLFVTEQSPRGFSVRENHGGRSSIAFGYRIVAKPFGKREPRLPMIARRSPQAPALAHLSPEKLRSLHLSKAVKYLKP